MAHNDFLRASALLREHLLAVESLHEFARQAWPHIEGGRPFVDGWHIGAICEHLEAVTYGHIRNLLINVPPRTGKSSLISVLWPAWVWLHAPHEQFLFASYAMSLSVRDSVKCRRLIQSPWYQSRWGDRFQLVSDQNAKERFENNHSGYRIASSTGGTATGEGGSFLVCVAGSTLIMTDRGEIPIQRIVEERLPVQVLTCNPKTGLRVFYPIQDYQKTPGHYRDLITLGTHVGPYLTCTADHPIYDAISKKYVPAGQLTRFDRLMPLGGDATVIKSVRKRKECEAYVYNLTIDGPDCNHSYFANGILTHNCDDPNNALDGESAVTRQSTNDWWDQVWSTRLNDAKTGGRVCVQQRIHALDISGHILANDTEHDITHVMLPMEFEAARRSKTVTLPSTHGKAWTDPRTKEGELLCPERFGPDELKKLKTMLRSEYAVAGQLQQRPSPEVGGIIKKAWFRWWKHAAPPEIQHTIQSWDTALEAGEKNAYSACTTWGIFLDEHKVSNLILLSVWRGRVEYPELRERAQTLYYDYRDDGITQVKPDGHHRPDMVLVEAKASGASLVQELIRAGIPAIRFNPNKYGDKIQRVRLITHLIEAGRVWVPARPPDYTSLRRFADVLVEEAGTFPNAESRDLVDTMTQALLRLNASGWIGHPSDEDRSDTSSTGAETLP